MNSYTVKRYIIIDTSNCNCGSDKIMYEVLETVRHQGASERHIMETVLDIELEYCYCPGCGASFKFKEI